MTRHFAGRVAGNGVEGCFVFAACIDQPSLHCWVTNTAEYGQGLKTDMNIGFGRLKYLYLGLLNLEYSMIDAAHRLAKNPNKPESPRGIIVKFCRRVDMEEMRQRAKVKKWINAGDLGYQSDNKIFINLSLSRESRILWNEVRKFKDDNNFKFAWITNSGKIFLRKIEGHAPVLVSEVSDLDKLNIPAVMRLDGVEVEGAAQIAEKFAQYFSSVYGHCQLDGEELWRRALRSPVMPGVPTMTLGSVTRNVANRSGSNHSTDKSSSSYKRRCAVCEHSLPLADALARLVSFVLCLPGSASLQKMLIPRCPETRHEELKNRVTSVNSGDNVWRFNCNFAQKKGSRILSSDSQI
ncbi:polycystic kidney disease protein 1-like [Homalodisca vitripennis]|nr:polycystic kidney disease protein 1-like [Homalodisca vitripennis]